MLSSFPPIRLLCRKGVVKKRDPGDDDEPESKVDPDADVKGECKDEDSGAETEDGKSKATVQGKKQTSGTSSTTWRFLALVPSKLTFFG